MARDQKVVLRPLALMAAMALALGPMALASGHFMGLFWGGLFVAAAPFALAWRVVLTRDDRLVFLRWPLSAQTVELRHLTGARLSRAGGPSGPRSVTLTLRDSRGGVMNAIAPSRRFRELVYDCATRVAALSPETVETTRPKSAGETETWAKYRLPLIVLIGTLLVFAAVWAISTLR